MTQVNQDMSFAVSLYDCEEGDCVKIEMLDAHGTVLMLTPQQARTFASELIQTVYRAEVKNSLNRKQRTAPVQKTERAIDLYGAHHYPA